MVAQQGVDGQFDLLGTGTIQANRKLCFFYSTAKNCKMFLKISSCSVNSLYRIEQVVSS